ncbi:MAG: Methionyl-tRNA formyltransferase [Myxococcota bacterium]|nr:Methionyl-tRNA formyltransferase [Myxococcota bacterium]
MGTPGFAVPALRALAELGLDVRAVLCQPDKPSGRGMKLTAPPVKTAALELGASVFQPARLKGDEALFHSIAAMKPRIAVVAAYGKLLPQRWLDLPELGCLNVHASLLPRWRGAAPIQRCIAAGDTESGVSLMKLVLEMDAGPVYRREAIPVGPEETGGELHDRLSTLGARMLKESLPAILRGELQPVEQNHALATHAPMLRKEESRINWNLDCAAIHNQVRAFNPWPGAVTSVGAEMIKVHRTHRLPDLSGAPGEVLEAQERLVAACATGAVELAEVQAPGKRRVSGAEFLRGFPVRVGAILGAAGP